ncbi:MAG: putative phosphoesterase [Myxococcota bacterium]|jgi:putative phosphoesterase
MRVALISDLHANVVALEAVLADAERAEVDAILCLGDVATLGPQPAEMLARLAELGCTCIRGNHDDFLLDHALIRRYTEAAIVVEAVEWCQERTTDAQREFLASFVPHVRIPLGGGLDLFAFHGTPRSNMEDLLATTPTEQLDAMLDGHRAAVMACGHTHIQMLRQHRGTLIVNPGSVGMPFAEFVHGSEPVLMWHAEYAIVTVRDGVVSADLRRVPVDMVASRAAMAASDNPLCHQILAHMDGARAANLGERSAQQLTADS